MTDTQVRQAFLLLLVVVATAAFLWMVRTFLLTILLAAVAAGLLHPFHARLRALLGGRRVPAALLTITLLLVLVIGPLLALLGAVSAEALRVSDRVRPQVVELLDAPGRLIPQVQALPGYALIAPYEDELLGRAAGVVGNMGTVVFDIVSATTRATAVAVFLFGVMLYALFFFLIDGPRLLDACLARLPLENADKTRMVHTFVSMARATLKGTLLVALVQGLLGGVTFWALGIDGAVFWGAVMTVGAIVPGVGTAVVWVPAAIVLAAIGQLWQAVVLVAVGAAVIGLVDNLMRPWLVGRDTTMPDLVIFLSTLGGIAWFGVIGFIVGPMLAALVTTVWDLFGDTYRRRAPA